MQCTACVSSQPPPMDHKQQHITHTALSEFQLQRLHTAAYEKTVTKLLPLTAALSSGQHSAGTPHGG